MKEKYFIYLQKKSCTRQFESKLSLHSFAFSLQKKSCTRQFESKLSLRSFAFSLQKKRRRKRKDMKQENNRIQLPLEEIKLAFAASCVEGAARKLGVPYIEIYERMRKVDLINKFILPHYDTLHTESREYLIEDVIECLTNWEKKASHQQILSI